VGLDEMAGVVFRELQSIRQRDAALLSDERQKKDKGIFSGWYFQESVYIRG
jgi:hypothetical protein